MKSTNSGFTLLELLISIVIVAVIISMLFGAVRLGISAWEKGEKDTRSMNRIRIVKRQLKFQLSSICTENIISSNEDNQAVPFLLEGTSDSLTFVSRYSIAPDTKTSLVYVRYFTDGDNFLLFEKDLSVMDHELIENQGLDVDDHHELVGNMEDLKFEYLEKDLIGEFNWMDHWENKIGEVVYPVAVRVSFVLDEKRVALTARLFSAPEKKP